MIAAPWMLVSIDATFPLVTTPWWVWALVIAAMLAVLAFSILLGTGSDGETGASQKIDMTGEAAPPAPDAHVAPRTAEIPTDDAELPILDAAGVHTPPSIVELPQPQLAPELPAASSRDDLKRIDGITPGVAAVLSAGGINSYIALSETSIDQLERVLRAAGMRQIDPAAWPAQARLAASGDWDALHALQQSLRAKKA